MKLLAKQETYPKSTLFNFLTKIQMLNSQLLSGNKTIICRFITLRSRVQIPFSLLVQSTIIEWFSIKNQTTQ